MGFRIITSSYLGDSQFPEWVDEILAEKRQIRLYAMPDPGFGSGTVLFLQFESSLKVAGSEKQRLPSMPQEGDRFVGMGRQEFIHADKNGFQQVGRKGRTPLALAYHIAIDAVGIAVLRHLEDYARHGTPNFSRMD
jgi:hypothetical protein